MAKIDDIKTMFEGMEGFHFRENVRHQLTDVTLPRNYELISKNVHKGVLVKLEFNDSNGSHFLFQS